MDREIVVVGMGYVGIPCAALFADVDGFKVTGVQRRSKRSGWKIECLNSGKSPFEGKEPGVGELIARVVAKGSLHVTDRYDACQTAEAILIDVQTPTDDEHVPRYDSLREVTRKIGTRMPRGVLIVVESTCAPGTTENIVRPILEKASGMKAGEDFSLAFSYERVMPGRLIEFFVNMPRIIGGIDERSTERGVELYRHVVSKEIIGTDCRTAEVAKTVENSYRDLNIAFANEMALICESMGVDVWDVRRCVNSRPDRSMHYPGAGVGGHCLPKDPWLLQYGANEWGAWRPPSVLIRAARKINDSMPPHMFLLIEQALGAEGVSLPGARVAVLGLSYLEDCDDTRNTPAVPLIRALQNAGASVIVHDPYVHQYDEEPMDLTADLEAALEGADCVAVVTAHSQYRELTPWYLYERMRTPILVDGRRVTDPDHFANSPVRRVGVGEPWPWAAHPLTRSEPERTPGISELVGGS